MLPTPLKSFLLLLFIGAYPLICAASAAADSFATDAKQAALIDVSTGTYLFEKESDAVVQPGNFAKLMTFMLAVDALKKGQVEQDTLFPVSEYAWRTGGGPSRTSAMFLPLNARVHVTDLMTGIGVVAGNDGSLVLAQGLAVSEAAIVVCT